MRKKDLKVLIVDDDRSVREALQRVLNKKGYQVLTAGDGREALEILQENSVAVVLTDLKMPKLGGLELLKGAKAIHPGAEVILITGQGDIEDAVQAMKGGAYDFFTKPFKRSLIESVVERAMEKVALTNENRLLKERLSQLTQEHQVIGRSEVMRRVMETVKQVAPTTATVLIEGESGTGKDLIAKAIHQYSNRSNEPFIKVSCAALPENLLEAELFGYEKGAFTGATSRKPGRFELADKGTLFLDEVGEITLAVQVKLLRVLQTREFEPLGGTKTLKSDVRLIAATNANLKQAIAAGRFREDLYYRLNVISIAPPPLRQRVEDIPLLAHHFMQIFAKKNNKAITGISEKAMALLTAYPWPGNVRELENAMERAVVLSKGDVIGPEDLPPAFCQASEGMSQVFIPIGTPLAEVERIMIKRTLEQTGGDKKVAAGLLGIASRTIYRKLNEKKR